MLGVFRNTLTANGKYPVRDYEKLSSPIQMKLSLKPNIFSDSFAPFLEYTLNFKHFEKQMIVITTLFLKLHTVNDLVTPLS